MTGLMVFLRIVHISSAIFWLGASLLFFEPTLRVVGAADRAVIGMASARQFGQI